MLSITSKSVGFLSANHFYKYQYICIHLTKNKNVHFQKIKFRTVLNTQNYIMYESNILIRSLY